MIYSLYFFNFPHTTKTKAELAKQSEAALKEQQDRLQAEAAEKVEAARKELEAKVEAAKNARDEANALYAKENRGRKAIHNKLLELQGNIRVLARVRPMLEVGGGCGARGEAVHCWGAIRGCCFRISSFRVLFSWRFIALLDFWFCSIRAYSLRRLDS